MAMEESVRKDAPQNRKATGASLDEQYDVTWSAEQGEANLLKDGNKGKDGPGKGSPNNGRGKGTQSQGSPQPGGKGKQPG